MTPRGIGREGMLQVLQVPFTRRTVGFLLTCGLFLLPKTAPTQAPPSQQAPARSDLPASAPSPATSAPAGTSEVSTHDTPATFKVRVNLVLVRAVVRDTAGHVVSNLKKEDFAVFDNRKPQVISTFSVETPESQQARSAATVTASTEPPAETPTPGAVLPQRFVAVIFDDANLLMQDAMVVRDAGTRLFGSLAPSDRVGIYTTSGQVTQEFTDDRAVLNKSLLGIIPRSLTGGTGFHDCPEIGYYQADRIENAQDSQSLAVATEDARQCAFNGDETKQAAAQIMAQAAAQRALSAGDMQTEYVYRPLEDTVRRLATMPGQRVVVLVSPGVILTNETRGSTDLVDRANRANIVINTIDARGL
jgi:VWFA-related protein